MTKSAEVSIPEDIARFEAIKLLPTLLLDRTTGKNIIWATNNYTEQGSGFAATDEITIEAITGDNAANIKRRALKDKEAQSELTKSHAEVFTPAWIVKLMVDAADNAWNERQEDNDTPYWQAYVSSNRLEITCGEAPYLVNRYDAADGSVTPLEERTGILSRKLQLINKHTISRDSWIKWATIALQSIYGYEFQGDNLLIARINTLCTLEDYFEAAGYDSFTAEEYVQFANIISWNLWQMDGLTKCVPFGIPKAEQAPASLFDLLEDTPKQEVISSECIIYDWKNDKQEEFASIRRGNDMKFDYIIGNPPYQEETDSESTRMPPIYNHFMNQSYEIADKVELITPARFLFDAGYTPHDWNMKMLTDPHFKVLYYEQRSDKIFPNTDIKGGIAITYHDMSKEFVPIEIFTAFEELNSILTKVRKIDSESSLSEIIYPALSYQLTDLMKQENPESLDRLRTSAFEKLSEIFFEISPDDGNEYVQMIGLNGANRTYRYVRRDYIKTPDNFESFKVILPNSNGSGALGEVLSTPLIGLPLIGHTQTFISIGNFATEAEAQACMKYVKSKFARTMLGVLKITQHNPGPKWKYVPLQDFTSSSDIDWSQSVAQIDVQLFSFSAIAFLTLS